MTKYTSVVDSGVHEEFDTGSRRDSRDGKGRFDLLPCHAMCRLAIQARNIPVRACMGHCISKGFTGMHSYLSGQRLPLKPVNWEVNQDWHKIPVHGWLRVAKHFENGAKKYAERNWEKGQPITRYLDSAIRHLVKHVGGDRAEDHLGACAWNLTCIIEQEERIARNLMDGQLYDLPPAMGDFPQDDVLATSALYVMWAIEAEELFKRGLMDESMVDLRDSVFLPDEFLEKKEDGNSTTTAPK